MVPRKDSSLRSKSLSSPKVQLLARLPYLDNAFDNSDTALLPFCIEPTMHSVTLPSFPVRNEAPVRPEAMTCGLSPLGTTGHNPSAGSAGSAGSAARAQPARQGEVLPSESETIY